MHMRPVKHSLTLNGHRTSVSLEPEFWMAFQSIAQKNGRSVNQLAAEIDAQRSSEAGLASAIRVYVLTTLQRQIAENIEQPQVKSPGVA